MVSPQERRCYDLLLAGLDLLDQAIAVFDAEPKLVAWNQALSRLLDFPPELVREGTPFEAFVRFNAERGEYGEGQIERLVAERMAAARSFQPHYFERQRPNSRLDPGARGLISIAKSATATPIAATPNGSRSTRRRSRARRSPRWRDTRSIPRSPLLSLAPSLASGSPTSTSAPVATANLGSLAAR